MNVTPRKTGSVFRLLRSGRFWAGLILAVVLVFGIRTIFSMSMMEAPDSNTLSRKVTAVIEEWTGMYFRIQTEDQFWREDLNNIVRKVGHVLEYLILGLLMGSFLNLLFYRNRVALPLGFVLCVVVAWIDESIQHFTPGRGPGTDDVVLDAVSALAGLLITGIAFSLFRHMQQLRKRINVLEMSLDETKARCRQILSCQAIAPSETEEKALEN